MSRVGKRFIKLGVGLDEINARDIPAHYTPASYEPSQIDLEGLDKLSAHLLGIDTKLLELTPINGDIAPTEASLLNNQTSASNVVGLVFDNNVVRSAVVHYSLVISADSSLYEAGTLILIQKESGWELAHTLVGDVSGIIFSINSLGQVQYTSPNFTDFSSGIIKFRAQTTPV